MNSVCRTIASGATLTLTLQRLLYISVPMFYIAVLANPFPLLPPRLTPVMALSRFWMLRDRFMMRRTSPTFHLVVFPPPLRPSPSWLPRKMSLMFVVPCHPPLLNLAPSPVTLIFHLHLPPIFVDPSQSCSQIPLLGSSVLSDLPISSFPLPPSSPCLDGASLPPGVANLPTGPSVPSSDQCHPSPPPLRPPTTSPFPLPWSQPVTPLSVSPCDSPSAHMLLLGSPPPSLTATPVLPPRVCRQIPSRISRLANNDLRHRIIHGAVPCDSGNPVLHEDQPCSVMGRVVEPSAASNATPSDLSSPVVGRQCV